MNLSDAPPTTSEQSAECSRWISVWRRVVEQFRREREGWGASLILHAALLLCLYAVILHLDEPRAPLSIDSTIGEEAGDESFDTLLDEAAFLPVAMESRDATSKQETLANESDLLISPDFAEFDGVREKSAEGDAGGGRVGFFGASAAGASFVFIVDSSGSMTGQRFFRATSELLRSIRRLKGGQKFYVIFFNSETIPMFYPRRQTGLISASAKNCKKVRRWIERQQPTSTTDPEGALRLALGMKPAVVFLMSDGEFDNPEQCCRAALEENRGGSVIHTIAFMSRDGENTLKTIARENGGTFRFVE